MLKDFKKYILNYTIEECEDCKYNEIVCPRMFKEESEVLCVGVHKYIMSKKKKYSGKTLKATEE